MIELFTLFVVLIPALGFFLLAGAVEWLICKLDKRDRLLAWFSSDTLGNARTIREARRRKAG